MNNEQWLRIEAEKVQQKKYKSNSHNADYAYGKYTNGILSNVTSSFYRSFAYKQKSHIS